MLCVLFVVGVPVVEATYYGMCGSVGGVVNEM
jgi:hypothetical protein